jgi:hypothetical protein
MREMGSPCEGTGGKDCEGHPAGDTPAVLGRRENPPRPERRFLAENQARLNFARDERSAALLFAFPASELRKAFDTTTWRRIISISVVVALALWLVGPTNYERSDNSVTGERAGRWGSIVWTLAAQTPHIGTHSFVVLGLMALGIPALVAIMLHAFRENYFPAETLLLAFYLIGYSAQPLAVQRYVEPPILLTFATFAARLPKARGEFDLVPVGLALIYATLTTLHNTEILGSVNG